MALVVAVLTGTTTVVRAQESLPQRDPDAFVNQQRAVDERLRGELETQLGDAAGTAFDWGGWYSLHLFAFDDGVESSRTLRRHDLRLWGRLSLDDGAHTFYARVRLSLVDFNAGDSYDRNEDDIEGPNLERGVYRFDLGKWRRDRNREHRRSLPHPIAERKREPPPVSSSRRRVDGFFRDDFVSR